jgi:FMN hydrolase / 5-amino-6-(5-phospho-D-ribitylamino)uracil phosphatase
MSERPILLLDVMSTLVTEPFVVDVPKFFGMSLEELFQVKDQTAWIEFEHGRMDEDEYAARFFRDGRPFDKVAFKAMMQASFEWMEGVEPLLEELKFAGYPMHALSNYSAWYQLIEEKLGLSRYVEWSFVSCKTGLRKPDREAYLMAARTLSVPPARCIFVDDRRKNVRAAEEVGMQGILRTSQIDDLRSDLRKLGVL